MRGSSETSGGLRLFGNDKGSTVFTTAQLIREKPAGALKTHLRSNFKEGKWLNYKTGLF